MSDEKDELPIDISAFKGLERAVTELTQSLGIPGPLAISHEELQVALKEATRKTKYNEDRRKGRIAPEPRTGTCAVCGGELTEKFHRQFDATSGPMIIGPGSAYQFFWASSGLYCQGCGLKYQHAPNHHRATAE